MTDTLDASSPATVRAALLSALDDAVGCGPRIREVADGTPAGVLADAVAVAAALIVVWAATVAAILPLVLHRLRVDPAVVSAPLITTLVDGTGLFIYLQIARMLLRH